MSGRHALMSEFDYALVEDTKLAGQGQNPVVSALCLLQIPGFYGCVDMLFGVPDAVGTRPEYLGRRLIKKLFLQMIHPATEARGNVIQLIAGIPHYYRYCKADR